MNGVSFNGIHSYNDLGLYLSERPDMGVPEPKTNIVEVPGMDGVIDMTEANAGEVKFENREIRLTFAMMANVFGDENQMAIKSRIRNALHGRQFSRIIFDEDPEWYWSGRVSVEISDVQDWKFHVTVTINAAPYAYRIAETVIDLDPNNQLMTMQRIKRSENISTRDWNSEFRFGTKEFPDGIGWDGLPQLIITWPENPRTTSWTRRIQVIDSDGHVYGSNISTPLSAGELRVSFGAITDAGVDLHRVYRVVVANIGGCSCWGEMLSAHVIVDNARKPVMPVFDLSADYAYSITINGVQRTIELGTHQYDDIVLGAGQTDIYIPLDDQNTVTTFKMSYMEGKL